MRRILTGALCGLLALVGCGNSKSTNSDGGDDGGFNYGGGSDDASEGGEGGATSDASDAGPAECVPPPSATMVQQTEAGVVGCQPERGAPFNCASLVTSYKLVCTAPTPLDGIPSPPSSADCNLASNGSAASLFYCCRCTD